MAGIKAEHILEMNFLDCFAKTERLHGNAALYVVLKDGIGFDGYDTYVMDVRRLPFKAPEMMLAPEPAPPAVINPSLRPRLVGVFDDSTGMALDSVQITDLATGTFAKTTVTGTATLGFLPEGQWTLELRRSGYAPLKLDVTISPRDTTALTLLLKRMK
jgi:hypothetical protein